MLRKSNDTIVFLNFNKFDMIKSLFTKDKKG
jgi:hypothetical protein